MNFKPIKIIIGGIVLINLILWVLLLSGNLTLHGLKLSGKLISTAIHEHGRCDNSFVTGVDYVFNPATMGFDALVEGSSLEASNLRCPSGSVSAAVFVNNGALYQHGSILFAEDNNFQKKKVYLSKENENNIRTICQENWNKIDFSGLENDEKGWYREVDDPLAATRVNCSGLIQIIPDYKNKGLEIVGTYIDREGVHRIAPEEVDKIKEICKKEFEIMLESKQDKPLKQKINKTENRGKK